MAIKIIDKGRGNRIDAPENIKGSLQVQLNGDNNHVIIQQNTTFNNGTITLGSNSNVNIGKSCQLNKLEIFSANFGSFYIGDRVQCTWHTRLYAHEPGTIEIGPECLIASGVLLSVSDMHSILDLNTNKRINPAMDICIGAHVWLAAEARVMGGVSIGDNTVIGVRSIVTKNIPENCVAAGVPARVIRTGTNWRADLI